MKPLAEWPLEDRRRVTGLLTDIDDTLTTDGRLAPDVLAALVALRAAGLKLIAVTGRPAYWAFPLLRLCGFDAVVAENGAAAFWESAGRSHSWFYADADTRAVHRRALLALADALRSRFPGIAVADDAPQRVGDLTFDIGENREPLPPAEVDRLLAFIRGEGFFATASSIHVHASLQPFRKEEASRLLLDRVFGIDDEVATVQYVFVGDSGNDAGMFAHYPQSVGVANVSRHLARLPQPPRYVTGKPCGAGFVEVAQTLLAARDSRRERQ